MSNLMHDLRYAIRMLAKAPAFTAMVVLTLALGIGANTAIFSLAYAIFRQAPPVSDPDSLVFIDQSLAWRKDSTQFTLSFVDYQYFREHNTSFADLAAHYSTSPMHLVVDGEPQAINASVVTSNYFGILGLQPAIGRFFVPEEDAVQGRNPVVVVSYSLWQNRLGASPQALGKTVQLNGTAFTVVGVAPRDFVAAGTGDPAIEAWIPSAMFRVGYRYCDAFARDCKVVRLLGRLKPDHTLAEAQQELSLLAQQLATAYPETNKGRGIVVTPARGIGPDDQKEYSGSLMLLLCAVAVVLLISCANVAGLLLARSLKRRKEVAVRLALGASRGRLVRQLLTESLLLAGLGGLLGLLVAFWAKDVISSFYAVNYAGRAMNFSLSLSPLVLLASIALTLITGVVFGLIPAVQSTRTDLTTALKSETPVIGKSRGHLRDILVITQVALSIVLLVAAGLLVRSLASIYRGPGYDPSQVVLVRLRPSLVGYDLQKGWAFQREVIRRLETVPGVVSASTAFYNAHEGGNDFRLWTPGHDPDKKEDAYTSRGNMVGPRFFETLKVSLLDGRDFTELDREGAPKVAIVNDVLARHFWPNQNAVGQSLIVDGKSTQVIGTVRDLHFYAFGEGPRPYLYLSYWQQGARDWNDSRTQVRVAGDPRAMLQIIRREITAVDPSVPINEDYPMTDRLRFQFRIVRGAETALVSLSGLALFLSAIGVYGVLAFAVSQRTREIGIRMALGASRRNVAGLVLRNGLAVTLIGVCLGLGGAMVLTRLMASLLYGISATDPVSFIAGAVLLLSVASIATYVPTRAAMRVDPMVALRYE